MPASPLASSLSLHPPPLITLGQHDAFTLRDAFEGVQIFGATGSGKTSGSGATLARAMLRANFGGLILSAKPSDSSDWQRWREQIGRDQGTLASMTIGGKWRINFIDYEYQRALKAGISPTENLARLFAEVSQAMSGERIGQGESYWYFAMMQMLRSVIDLVTLSEDRLTLQAMLDVVDEAPKHPTRHAPSMPEATAWDKSEVTELHRRVERAHARLQERSAQLDPRIAARDRRRLDVSARYLLNEFPNLAEETRSCVVSVFTSLADVFVRGDLQELFCTDTTVTPEHTHRGLVLLADLPVLTHGETGRAAQLVLKLIWQRATQGRTMNERSRPVFLWADEAHYFASEQDGLFVTTARSAQAATVFLTQSIENYRAMIPGPRGDAFAKQLIATFGTKIFHANADPGTNRYASDLFGQTWVRKSSGGSSINDDGKTSTSGQSSEQLAPQVLDSRFLTLRKGGPENQRQVDAIVAQSGRVWKASQSPCLLTCFTQEG